MATRKVGGIVAELLLNDKDFRQKLDRAGKLTESRAAQMRKTFNAVGKAALTAAAAAGGTLAAGIALANTRMDQLAKTSDKLGIAPEKLQELRYAANQAGIAMNVLDTATQRMVRRVSEASQGRGTALGALEELNLDAKEMARLAPEEQMRRIADGMSRVATQGDRVRLAMALFDTEGVALVNMLRNGSEGLESMSEEFRKFGVSITRLDLAKIEAANDNFSRLKTIQEGFWNQLAVQSAPVLEMIGDGILDIVDDFGGMDKVAETVMNNLVNAAGHVGDVFWGWSVGITAAQEGAMRLASMVARIARELGVFDKIAEFQHGLSVVGHEQGLRAAAIQELVREEAITPHPRWNVREGYVNQRLNRPDEKLIEERIDHLRNELHGIVPDAPAPLVSDDFLKDLENDLNKGAEDLATRLQDRISGGKPSERIRIEFERLHTDFERRAKELESKVGQNVDEALDPLADLGESAEAAAKELEKLTVQDIADLDPTGSRGSLARRILDLEEQARREEAQGRDRAAERSRERAQELRDRLETLQQGGSQVQGDQGFQERRDRMRERNFIGPRLPEGEVSPESESAPEVRSGSKVDRSGEGGDRNSSVLLEILAAIKALPESVGAI